MIILARVRRVNGRARIPGYEKNWFEVDTLDYQVENSRPSSSDAAEEDTSLGRAVLHPLKIKKLVDRSTCDLMFESFQGKRIESVEVQVIETAKNGASNFPVLLLRFEDVFLTDWKMSFAKGAYTEDVSFDYMKVALEYHRTSDGVKYERVANSGWDASVVNGKSVGGPWTYTFKTRGDIAAGGNDGSSVGSPNTGRSSNGS